jgi:hypothetical protein
LFQVLFFKPKSVQDYRLRTFPGRKGSLILARSVIKTAKIPKVLSCHPAFFYFRLKGPDPGFENDFEAEDNLRVVLTAPTKDLVLEVEDFAFMLVQYVNQPDDEEIRE